MSVDSLIMEVDNHNNQNQSKTESNYGNSQEFEVTSSQQSSITIEMSSAEASQSHSQSGSETADTVPRAKRKLTLDEENGVNGDVNKSLNQYEELSFEVEKAKQRLVDYLVDDSRVVDNIDEGRQIIDRMMETKSPVAVDCEGVNLGDRYQGNVTLVQVAEMTGDVFLFDVLVEPKLAVELQRLLESEDIVKVMHDCRSDSEGLDNQFKIKLKRVFDTQVAHIVIRKGTKEYNAGDDKSSGLDKICRTYGGAPNPFKDAVKGVYKTNQKFWANRPLSQLMISYAASDVLCLVPTVYNELSRQIVSDEDKKSFEELCEQQVNQIRDKHNNKKQGHAKQRLQKNNRGHGRGGGYNQNHPGRGHLHQNPPGRGRGRGHPQLEFLGYSQGHEYGNGYPNQTFYSRPYGRGYVHY